MGANKTLSWLHDRMPAILETEEQVQVILIHKRKEHLGQFSSLYTGLAKCYD
jgi:putative SOS response-associated peptidase YedK